MNEFLQGHDVPESIYRASPEWAASDLKSVIDYGLEATYIRKFGKDNPPKTATPAMKLGSMIHKFILEPDDFSQSYALLEEKRSKKGKELALACEEKGLLTYNSQDKELLDSIEHSLVEDKFAWKYLLSKIKNKQGKAEQSFWWTHPTTGLPCKCRCDYVVDDMVIDLKTCGEGLASPDRFQKTVVNLNYHLAAAHYLQGTGAKKFLFVCVEKVFPYSVGIYQLSQSFINKGYELQEQTLQKILEATKTKHWCGYTNAAPNGIQTLTPPKWI